jgi:uncharacterized protein
MSQNGHDFFISAKDKEVNLALLNRLNIKYYNRGKAANNPLGKAINIIKSDINLMGKVRKFGPDIVISFSSPIGAHLAFLLHKPCIAIEDTECANLVHRSYIPISKVALTPTCFQKKLGKKQIYFNSYKELGYLHPNYFKSQTNIHELLNINSNISYAIVRFVSHNALHDYGERSLSEDYKIKLIENLSSHLKVFISSETKLSEQFKPYQLSIPAWEMHAVIAGATLLIGESATMAAEAAMLGVPAIFIDNQGRGYTNELEKKYSLVYSFKQNSSGLESALNKAIELIQLQNGKEIFQKQRIQMLEDKIDLTAFLVWFVENYPASVKIMQDNPVYQYNFK